MRNEWEKECERFLFDFGRHVLGKNAGGIVNKLMHERGISAAWNVIRMAAQKSDPREYIGAAMREKPPSVSTVSEEEAARLMSWYRQKRIMEGWS